MTVMPTAFVSRLKKEYALSENTPMATIEGPDQIDGELHKMILVSLDDDLAQEIVTISLAGKSAIADHMVIATGRSKRHVGALADHLQRKLKEFGLKSVRTEGMSSCAWVLVDAGDVVVHLFREEVRSFYDLEKMWAAEAIAMTYAPNQKKPGALGSNA